MFASLGALITERVGVTNIGIEGMMTIGALMTAIIGSAVNPNGNHNGSQIWVVLIGALVGGVVSLLHAFPAITLKANQIISSTALNIVCMGLAMFLATSGWFGTNTSAIDSHYQAILFGQAFPMWLLIALIVLIVVGIFFKYTREGLRFSMTGENPSAVDAAGISVYKIRYWGVFISGLLAGLAGGVLVTTVVGSGVFSGSVYGLGFLALAIMIFGQWKTHYVAMGVILFAFLFALGNRIGNLVDPTSSFVSWAKLLQILPFVLTLLTMMFFSKRSQAPLAVGIPYDKARR